MLAGLTSQRSLTAQSYAVSFSIMAVISIALLLALLSWPFVKLLLIGDAQRIKAHDVVLVGTSALLGIALITISVLDLYAYKTLEATLDDQLQTFAEDISGRANDEIKAAVGQLARLETAVDRPDFPGPRFPEVHSISDLAGRGATGSQSGVKPFLLSDEDLRSYPDFESFSLIDEEGKQIQKMTLGSFVTPHIKVDDREYFIHWTTPAADATAFFEPIQSATTGAREAVVSTRTKSGRVAALSIPMRTLIDPIIVPGFGFVAIDDAGKVLFHSDPQHSLSENFFIESDKSQRLRALVVARHQEWVSVKYWGEDHRAFVFPMHLANQPFTLITFYDQNNVRAVNIDWLVITATFLLLYAGAYVAACIADSDCGPEVPGVVAVARSRSIQAVPRRHAAVAPAGGGAGGRDRGPAARGSDSLCVADPASGLERRVRGAGTPPRLAGAGGPKCDRRRAARDDGSARVASRERLLAPPAGAPGRCGRRRSHRRGVATYRGEAVAARAPGERLVRLRRRPLDPDCVGAAGGGVFPSRPRPADRELHQIRSAPGRVGPDRTSAAGG